MKPLLYVILLSCLAAAAPLRSAAAERDSSDRVSLDKRQLAALMAAVEAMRRHGYSFRGKQVVVRDEGDFYYVTFMEDPIDIAIVGGHNATGWQIRKRDAHVVREVLVR